MGACRAARTCRATSYSDPLPLWLQGPELAGELLTQALNHDAVQVDLTRGRRLRRLLKVRLPWSDRAVLRARTTRGGRPGAVSIVLPYACGWPT